MNNEKSKFVTEEPALLHRRNWRRRFRTGSRLHRIRLRDERLCRILPINVLFRDQQAVQPALVLVRVEDHHHALFIVEFVEALHQRVPVGVDRQHRKRQQLICRPVFPDSSDRHRPAVDALDAPAHRLASFLVGLKEIGGRDDTELLALPGAAEGWLSGHHLGACVVGLTGQLVIGPVRHHAEHGWGNFQLTIRFVWAALDWRHVASPSQASGWWTRPAAQGTASAQHAPDGQKCLDNTV